MIQDLKHHMGKRLGGIGQLPRESLPKSGEIDAQDAIVACKGLDLLKPGCGITSCAMNEDQRWTFAFARIMCARCRYVSGGGYIYDSPLNRRWR